MSEEHIKDVLRQMLRLQSGPGRILRNHENSQLEFKETFNFGNRVRYARTMAAFANNRGGYIVFGVEPSPHRLKGVNLAAFESVDPAQLTQFLNSYFSPLIEWKMDLLREFEADLGYIYTHEATDKPVVATASKDQVKEGEIYFRYNGQSTVIKYAELRGVIDDRLDRERQAWLQHLRTIARTGPTNVAMLDTVQGKLYGGGTPFIIDEALLRKLKFLRQGKFSETEGRPTLRLVGDVQPVSGVHVEKPVEVGIHEADIIEAFLAQRALEPSQARAYLRETAYQATPYLPLWYLLSLAGMSLDKAIQFLRGTGSPRGDQVNKLVDRLAEGNPIEALGAVGDVGSNEKPLVAEAFERELSSARTQKDKRTLLLAALQVNPAAVAEISSPVLCVLEAITHLPPSVVRARKAKLLELLLAIYTRQFSVMTSPERSVFRKAVAFCDQTLNRNDALN